MIYISSSSPAVATATSSSLAALKSKMVLPFWCQIVWAVLEKRPLNGSVCLSKYITQMLRLSIVMKASLRGTALKYDVTELSLRGHLITSTVDVEVTAVADCSQASLWQQEQQTYCANKYKYKTNL